jgi:WD40 repeat protein
MAIVRLAVSFDAHDEPAPPYTFPQERSLLVDGGAAAAVVPPQPSAAEPIAAAPRIEGYQILAPLGQGAMGTVWRAVQLSTRREVAVKLLNLAQFGSERARRLFQREVELAARLHHPNVAAVHDSGLHTGVCYYAMELVADGVPLDAYVARERLSRRRVLEVMRTICDAVAYAHRRGVIHRDLKPSNILVDREGRPRVLDFGLAEAIAGEGAGTDESSDRATLAGTPAFMSPEQAAGAAVIDTRSDVYSLGVILYRLLAAGRSPHDPGGSPDEVLRRIATEDPLDPRAADATIDAELQALLLKALARRPDDRYASADALARDIDNYLRGEPLAARRATLGYVAGKWLGRHRGAVALALVIAAILLATAITSERSVRKARDRAVASARDANVRLVTALLSQGDARAAVGGWLEARGLYEQALDLQRALGLPAGELELAIAQADLYAPPPLAVLGETGQWITAAAIAPDGRTAATADRAGRIRLWDLPTTRILRELSTDPPAAVHSLHFGAGPRSSWLLSASDDKAIRIWDHRAGQLVRRIDLPDQLGNVALSPDGRWLASGSMTRLPRLWRLIPDDSPQLVEERVDAWASTPVQTVGFSPDSFTLAYGDWLGNPRLWNLSARTLLDQFPQNASLVALDFSPDGQQLLASYSQGAVEGFSTTRRGPALETFFHLPNGATALRATSATSAIAIFLQDGSARLLGWAATEGRAILLPARTFAGVAAAISPDGRTALGNDPEGRLVVRDLAVSRSLDLKQLLQLHDQASNEGAWVPALPRATLCQGHARGVTALALSPDRRLLASGGADETLRLWDAASGTPRLQLDHLGEVTSLAFSPDGQRLLYGSRGSVAAIVDPADGHTLVSRRFPHAVVGVAFTPDARRALIATDHIGYLWDLEHDALLHEWPAHVTFARGVCCSADGRRSAVADVHGLTLAADLASGEPLKWGGNTPNADLPDRRREIASNAVSFGDLRRMLGGSGSAIVEWSSEDGRELARLEGHAGTVRALALTPDGHWLLSGGDDKTFRVWDRTATPPRELRAFRLHPECISAVALSADGRTLAAGDEHGLISIVDLDRPAAWRAAEFRARAAALTLARDPADAVALRALADWYALRSRPDWAKAVLRD